MTTDRAQVQQRIRELEAANGAYIAEISRLEARLGELGGEVGRLQAELQQKRGVRHQASGLYRAIDLSITSRIERKGYTRKPPSRTGNIAPIAGAVVTAGGLQAVNKAARSYDASAYFVYRTKGSGMRLRYRIVGGLYRVARDTAVAGAKKALRVARKVAQ